MTQRKIVRTQFSKKLLFPKFHLVLSLLLLITKQSLSLEYENKNKNKIVTTTVSNVR